MLKINAEDLAQIIADSEATWKVATSKCSARNGSESLEWRRVDGQLEYRIVTDGKPGDKFYSFD